MKKTIMPREFLNLRKPYYGQQSLEVRRPLEYPDDLSSNAYYKIRFSGDGVSQDLVSITVVEEIVGYTVKRRFNVPGERPSTIKFSFTREAADQFAQGNAIKLANKLGEINGLATYDVSERDKKDLEMRIKEIKQSTEAGDGL